ncbi:HlyD family type I secretion periplasmic adaptor subunit [Pseudoalteromonas luteoviolacea]|uniref:Membrane fusion protein (MFP) family protein n=1 Tax=Pseudoalteromonas luteoviolacea (strain 2ta16) TaxID=1353533 RepID=V4HX69_PSEL2|nr:HlyD family type I secretion periplasmic adaptor subunit [Pseudoalteromonas luteoviolacea]ESP92549.1 type I secretion membrane fusion protein, HlyD family [Pseudoalteromonas luteoviolacea 2ta16]KZN32731.1 hypothetical protein N483_26890 [Pseudoalteromonas luteoviolacea NCIMB 1944]
MSKLIVNTKLIEFLPPVLEVQTAPPPKLVRGVLWTLVSFFSLAIIWAIVGRIDIVAKAQGQLIPLQKVKVIQPLETGSVQKIHVEDGDKVTKGQVLVSLESVLAESNYRQTQQSLANFEQQRLRRLQLLQLVQNAQIFDDVSPALTTEHKQLLNAEFIQYQNEQAVYDAKLSQLEAQLAGAKAKLVQLDKILPLLNERVDSLESLQDQKLVARATYLELKQQAVQQQEQRLIELTNVSSINHAIKTNAQEQRTHSTELQKLLHSEISQINEEILTLQQELEKQQYLTEKNLLLAPVNGIVEALQLSTIGEVVTPAQQLLTVVPDDDELIVNAQLLNKDIGFTFVGQDVVVKVDSFPFTRYGAITGEVTEVSTDAVKDEQLGLYFPIKVRLHSQHINVENRSVPLSAGMSVNVEIKTGNRRIIEFLLSPIIQHLDEGARER